MLVCVTCPRAWIKMGELPSEQEVEMPTFAATSWACEHRYRLKIRGLILPVEIREEISRHSLFLKHLLWKMRKISFLCLFRNEYKSF